MKRTWKLSRILRTNQNKKKIVKENNNGILPKQLFGFSLVHPYFSKSVAWLTFSLLVSHIHCLGFPYSLPWFPIFSALVSHIYYLCFPYSRSWFPIFPTFVSHIPCLGFPYSLPWFPIFPTLVSHIDKNNHNYIWCNLVEDQSRSVPWCSARSADCAVYAWMDRTGRLEVYSMYLYCLQYLPDYG